MFASFALLLLVSVYIVHSAPPRDIPADLYNPSAGDIQELESPCPNYSRCGSDGLKYWKSLMNKLASPNPVDRAGDWKIYKTYYGHLRVSLANAGQEVEQDLLKHGLGPLDDHYQRWHVFSLPQDDLELVEESPYQNLFNTNTGVIVGVYNRRAEDHSLKQLQWSEIAYQTYLLALEAGQSISALQVVIQTDIVNSGTYNVARSAYKSIGTLFLLVPRERRTDSFSGLDADEDETWRRWTLAEQEVAKQSFPIRPKRQC